MSIFRAIRYAASRQNSSSASSVKNEQNSDSFENVYTFPFITKLALLNRLKVYQFYATGIAIPSSGMMEFLNIVPEHTIFTTSYVGITGLAVLSLFTMPFKDVIGHLYISEDNKSIKISSLDFYGKRKDKIISADDWIPIYDMKPSVLDGICLRPELKDGTKYKLLVKFGTVKNPRKMAEVLE